MDQDDLRNEVEGTTPIFGAYRKGYDPDQVDRYVAEQQRRLDETLNRASIAERRLAAAVGQLRELHRRVTILESEDRGAALVQAAPAQPIDTLGERIQRILQESWEGANALRQAAESDASEIRQRTVQEAESVMATARAKAKSIDEEIERRRRSYLGRVEEERSRTVAQITYLHDQRKLALADLNRVKEAIEATVDEVGTLRPDISEDQKTVSSAGPSREVRRDPIAPLSPSLAQRQAGERHVMVLNTKVDVTQPPTMPVFRLETHSEDGDPPDTSELVRSHRASLENERTRSPIRPLARREPQKIRASVFDFEEEAPS